jgi:hypothetical protein
MTRIRTLGVAALVVFTACDGLKEALTAHVDVVARAGSQELSVQRMAEMMGKSQVPVRREVAQSIADAWVNFHLLGQAAADNDSLTDRKLIDEVMWPAVTQTKIQKFGRLVSESFALDTTNLEQKFETSGLLAARHILFPTPQGDDRASDSVRKVAEAVRVRATSANFAQLAKQYGSDGTKDQGGDLGVFAPDAMVAEFTQGVASIKPGEIGPLVRTNFGWHIVRRSTYDEVKEAFKPRYVQRAQFIAESTFITGLETGGKIELEPSLAKTVKAVAADPVGHEDDGTAVAKTRFGTFRAKYVARWIQGFPNPDQVRASVAQAPDSVIPLFMRQLLRSEFLLRAADSAKVTMDSTEQAGLYSSFAAILQNAWAGLRVSPHMVADSAKTDAEKAVLIPARIDGYMDRLIKGQEQFVEVPAPLAQALRSKFDWKINAAGIDRAVQSATTIRAREDSLRAAASPKSAVPMPTPPGDSGTPPAGRQ